MDAVEWAAASEIAHSQCSTGIQEIQLNAVLIKRPSFSQIDGIISSDVERTVMDEWIETEKKPKEGGEANG